MTSRYYRPVPALARETTNIKLQLFKQQVITAAVSKNFCFSAIYSCYYFSGLINIFA